MHRNINEHNCFVTSFVQSHNLVNAAYFDADDSTASVATWTESKVGTATDWYS